MNMPDRMQANYCFLDVAGGIIESVKDNLGEDFDTDYFQHRLEILHIGIKATLGDMKRVMDGEAQVRSGR